LLSLDPPRALSVKPLLVLRLLAVGGAALILQGCPPSGTTTFVNNTGQAITVHYADKTISVADGASGAIESFIWPRTFEIATPRQTWHYANVQLETDFTYPTFDFGLRVRQDGRVYAFQTAEAKKKFSGQPPGHPLRPKV
jgi:hypothetical protein